MNKFSKKQSVIKKEQNKIVKSVKDKEIKDDAVKKHYTSKEVKEYVLKSSVIDCDPKYIEKEIASLILSIEEKKEINEKAKEKLKKAYLMYGLETHYHLASAVNNEYSSYAIRLSNHLIEEFDCKTASEIILVETIVGAYLRILALSGKLNCYVKAKMTSRLENNYYMILSKELDRANNHFITALTTLKQIKSPGFEINVKTKAAFISKNQQINAINQMSETDSKK